MELKTKEQLVRTVAERWKVQRYVKMLDSAAGWYHPRDEEIHKNLLVLSPEASEQEVTNIVGNDTWTRNRCDECGEDTNITVTLGEPYDYESATATICVTCLYQAQALVDKV